MNDNKMCWNQVIFNIKMIEPNNEYYLIHQADSPAKTITLLSRGSLQ